jgi:hypothetical protein
MARVGERVGTILSADEKTVKLIGYGVYVGDEVPHDKVAGHSLLLREIGATNPKIQLDSGKDVFGCECWWGPEEKVKKMIGEREVVAVDIDAIRSEAIKTEEVPNAT